MKVFIQRETGDASLCRTALSVLESLVTLLQQLMDGKTDLRQLIEATLVDGDGRPRTAENGDPTYQKYHKQENDIHIQTRYKRPTDNKKGGISAATDCRKSPFRHQAKTDFFISNGKSNGVQGATSSIKKQVG